MKTHMWKQLTNYSHGKIFKFTIRGNEQEIGHRRHKNNTGALFAGLSIKHIFPLDSPSSLEFVFANL